MSESMLTDLHIKNFAIIDSTELELSQGMTTLTGETGAGKSILLDALGLVLGDRANSDCVQQGKSRADITATFNLENSSSVLTWLQEHELDSNDECIVRRTLSKHGKSRATINDIPVSINSLKSLGAQLVTIHGQNSHQSLSSAVEQKNLLDNYAGKAQLLKVCKAYEAWKKADNDYTNYTNEAATRSQRLDLVSFQLQEFDDLDTGNLSTKQIEDEHQWLANVDRVMALGSTALAALDEQAYPALGVATPAIKELATLDERLQEALDLVESATIQISESAQSIRASVSAMDHDDARLAWLDEKLAAIHKLSRKHLCEPHDLATVENRLRDEYDELVDPHNNTDELLKIRDVTRSLYDTEAGKLSRHRKKQASKLSATISAQMQHLSMTGGEFRIDVVSDIKDPHINGLDTITFMVSPNPGVSPAPLSRIASGGELSRISLCFQLAILGTQSVPTLVFDEVDSGVGGAVAETVGQLLRQVGSKNQVLCVTHLPQVAAQAHHHLKVSKQVVDGRTQTQVSTLNATKTRDEVARMLGGAKLTKKSRQHAQEMLDSAASDS